MNSKFKKIGKISENLLHQRYSVSHVCANFWHVCKFDELAAKKEKLNLLWSEQYIQKKLENKSKNLNFFAIEDAWVVKVGANFRGKIISEGLETTRSGTHTYAILFLLAWPSRLSFDHENMYAPCTPEHIRYQKISEFFDAFAIFWNLPFSSE